MVRSNLLTILAAAALVFANVACACANVTGAATPPDAHAHHHIDSQASSDRAPCPHQGCDDCADVLEGCQNPEYGLERDTRPGPTAKVDLDDSDPGAAPMGTGPPLPALALSTRAVSTTASPLRQARTPVQLKDQIVQ